MNKALRGATKKGYLAHLCHVSRTDNPYPDHRTFDGSVTFSRAFRTAWRDGWDMAADNLAHGDNDGWYDARWDG